MMSLPTGAAQKVHEEHNGLPVNSPRQQQERSAPCPRDSLTGRPKPMAHLLSMRDNWMVASTSVYY